MLTKVLTLILLTFIVTSCGDKKAVSSVKLKLFQSNVVTGTTPIPMEGGVLLMGKSEDGLNSFRTGVIDLSKEISLTLIKGRWEFAAVSWSGGNGPLTGDNRCAYTGFVDLKDSEVSVSFNLSSSRCLSTFNGRQFSSPDYRLATGRFLDFIPVMCFDNSANPASEQCKTYTQSTNIASYRIIYNSEQKGQVTGEVLPLASQCLPLNAAPRARIPVTDTGTDSPFGVRIVFYIDSSCGVSVFAGDFHDGIKDSQLPFWSQSGFVAGYYSYLFINPGQQFNNAAAEPRGLILNGLMINGVATFPAPQLSYSIPSHPANAVSMCLTTSSTCSSGDWRALDLSGNVSVNLADGAYVLKLFYKTVSGVVSTTPSYANFNLDTTAPMAPIVNAGGLSNASMTTGVNVVWTSPDVSSFDHYQVDICSDVTCTSIRATYTQTSLSPMEHKFVTINPNLTLGETICMRVMVFDKFARTNSNTPYCTVSIQ